MCFYSLPVPAALVAIILWSSCVETDKAMDKNAASEHSAGKDNGGGQTDEPPADDPIAQCEAICVEAATVKFPSPPTAALITLMGGEDYGGTYFCGECPKGEKDCEEATEVTCGTEMTLYGLKINAKFIKYVRVVTDANKRETFYTVGERGTSEVCGSTCDTLTVDTAKVAPIYLCEKSFDEESRCSELADVCAGLVTGDPQPYACLDGGCESTGEFAWECDEPAM